jgi:hypothetical protein
MDKFYVYGHFIPNDDKPFYIGKGIQEGRSKRNRAWAKDNRNKWWHNIVNKYGYDVKILHSNLTNEEAINKEKELIAQYGRKDIETGILVNMTDGGDGQLNNNVSEITRQKLSMSLTRYYSNPEIKAKLSEKRKMALSSEDVKNKCREAAIRGWEQRRKLNKTQSNAEVPNDGTHLEG